MAKPERRKFTDEQKIDICNRVAGFQEEGYTFNDACKKVDVYHSVVRGWMKKIAAGEIGKPKRKVNSTDEDKKEAVRQWEELRAEGMDLEDAAKQVGHHSTVLYKWRKEFFGGAGGEGLPTVPKKKTGQAAAQDKMTPMAVRKVEYMCPRCGQLLTLNPED